MLTIGFFLLLGWMGYKVLGVLATDTWSACPSVPVGWVQSVIPISAVLIVAAELDHLPAVLANTLRRAARSRGGGLHWPHGHARCSSAACSRS